MVQVARHWSMVLCQSVLPAIPPRWIEDSLTSDEIVSFTSVELPDSARMIPTFSQWEMTALLSFM